MDDTMRHHVLLIFAVLAMLLTILLAGCGLILPKEAGIAEEPPEDADQDIHIAVDEEVAVQEVQPEPEVEGEDEKAEETVPAEPAIPVSGSLDLQLKHDLCPHLVTNFSCNKYDLRSCGYTQLIAKEQFYPNVLNCRDGYIEGQVFCLIQECMPITEENIVTAYGGITAYAEYTYTKTKAEGGIMLYYKLSKCGEMELEFENQDKCRFYRSTSGLP